MRYCFDIDGTITSTSGTDYAGAVPDRQFIEEINKLYDDGHYIIFQTARGSITGIDWRELTLSQLSRWGVKFHELWMGKPTADIYIDDKGKGKNEWIMERFSR